MLSILFLYYLRIKSSSSTFIDSFTIIPVTTPALPLGIPTSTIPPFIALIIDEIAPCSPITINTPSDSIAILSKNAAGIADSTPPPVIVASGYRGQVIMITHFLLLLITAFTAGCDTPNTLAILC